MSLQSPSHDELRDHIWAMLIDEVKKDDPILGEATKKLVALMDANRESELFKNNRLADEIQAILPENLNIEQKFTLSNIMTLLAHLSRSSSIAAAQNDLNNHADGKLTSDTMGMMVKQLKASGMTRPDQIIRHLKQIAMDNVFTAHPTYIGDLDFAKDLRALDYDIQQGDEKGVSEKLGALLHANPLVEGRLTAQDETVYMRHYLKNAYRQVKYVYEHIDQAMAENGIKDYDPTELKLDLTFQSWGSSGDKDGNKNITFQSLRDAIHTHRECVVNAYIDDMQRIIKLTSGNEELRRQFLKASGMLHAVVEHGSNSTLLPKNNSIDDTINALKQFADYAYENTSNDDAKRYALGLSRTVDTFGLHLGQIEFRETADELKFVLNHVIDADMIEAALGEDTPKDKQYSQLEPAQKEQVINHLLDHWNKLDKHVQDNIAQAYAMAKSDAKTRRFEYRDSGTNKDGTPKANQGIFIHTLERLKLAARNPDMVKGQVLAEATKPVEVKEMLLLLKATKNDENMRIIPLFEDPDVLKEEAFEKTMNSLNQDRQVLKHNIEVSLREWDEKVQKGLRPALSNDVKMEIKLLPHRLNDNENTKRMFIKDLNDIVADETHNHATGTRYLLSDVINTQIQLAHSDNARRGGTAGARARIYKAHEVARNSAQDIGIGVHFFEGGSHTDSFRMGVRSYRSLVNMYNSHKFMKCTVQGMDLAQLFSNPATIESFIEENIANAARILREKSTGQHLTQTRAEQYVNRAMYDQDSMLNPIIDSVDRYREDYFGSEENPNIPLGNIMAQVFHYQENKDSGTIGSRSGGRAGATDMSLYINPVKETRTIGYSETFQHGRLNPNYIGAGKLREMLVENGLVSDEAKTEKERTFKHDFSRVAKGDRLHTLYTNSPFLRDAIDRTAYAVATTDFDKVWDNAMYDYSKESPFYLINKAKEALEKLPENILVDGVKSALDTLNSWLESFAGHTKPKRTLILGTREQIEAGTNPEPETINKRPEPSELKALAANKESSAEGMLAWLELEYRDAAAMVIEAIGKKPIDMQTTPTRELTLRVRDELKMYKDTFAMQDVLMETADAIQHSTPKSERNGAVGTVINGLNKSLHNVRDMATLVRPPFQSELINQGIKKEAVIEQSQARSI